MTAQTLPTIITDLDGTLVDTASGIVELVWNHFGVVIEPNQIDEYDMAKAIGPYLASFFTNVQQVERYFTHNAWTRPAFFADLKPHWGLWNALHVHKKHGGHILFWTCRVKTPAMLEVTGKWLERWGFDPNNMYFTTDKCTDVGRVKSTSDAELWFIDDKIETFMAVNDTYKDVRVLVPDRPWTKMACILGKGLRTDLIDAEILDKVLEVTDGKANV